VCAAAVIVTLTAVNRMTDSDAMGTLLVTESILERGTVFLDGYYPDVLTTLANRIEYVDGRPAYLFPLGTSLIALPVVAVLKSFGIGVLQHDHEIQIALAATAAALSVLLMYLLARRFLGHWTALALAGVFWFGTSLASTGATALWSHDFAAVLSLLSLLLLVVAVQDRRRWPLPLLVVVLAAGLVVRPQLAPLAVGVVVVLALLWWRAAVAVCAGLLGAGAALLAANHAATGRWLPSYYLPQRLEGGEFWTALTANLVSPARGLVVFSPFLLVVPLLIYRRRRFDRTDGALIVLGLAWPLVHLIAISRFPHWWGGWGFGPRLMMDVLPGLFLATVAAWPRSVTTWGSRLAVAAFALLAGAAIWVNTVQGLYNPYTRFWYVEPSVDQAPDMVTDWSYPQFLANERGHEDRLERLMPDPPDLAAGIEYSAADPAAGLVGWSTGFASPGISLDRFLDGRPPEVLNEEGRRWSEGRSARIVVTIPAESVDSFAGNLRLALDVLPPQAVGVYVNGVPVQQTVLVDDKAVVLATFDPRLLTPGRNVVTLELPDARSVGQASDYRSIAVALKSMTLS
jgi:hypothetical protein